ncbi:pyridoxamine 5'-phosphate oxidase family protein [Leifsonia sp. Root112D2]|uniref:pyridoxamine 5'-phosphate oxidase family protein n=1 Tax=Leifsonia sp. Root112D2 TaxID=1736426 RepID=UPI0006F6CDBF|nr:pyridoxamine 5'-phosphate oxidase family protein [Leifsonia sp. Root112D2]KQV06854.1 hypothetical protein ASC63_05645 [Leifsonia sp. Root112D2]
MTIDPGDPLSVAEFVRREQRGVIATISAKSWPQAALVGLAALDDGTLIFDSPVSSRKIENLRSCDRIAVVVGTGGDVSVQIEGIALQASATVERGRLAAAYAEQFPGSRALADGFAVVGIRPSWVRVYDASTDPPAVTEATWNE